MAPRRHARKQHATPDQDHVKLESGPQAADSAQAQAPQAQWAAPVSQMVALQRSVGNAAVRRLVQDHAAPDHAREAGEHGRGCGCAACSTVARAVQPGLIQREGETDTPTTTTTSPPTTTTPPTTGGGATPETTATTDAVPTSLTPEQLASVEFLTSLASKITIAVFIPMASLAGASLKTILNILFTYWPRVQLSDIDEKVKAATAEAKKAVWSDTALMTLADTKLGRDDYLTFATHLGMHHPPTTDELSEGGEEHTPAPEADRLIRSKLDKYVANAAAAGRQITGQVAVVGGDDWDRAGIQHYGEVVWKTGPPPKTPKRDAINGFVDSQGRVWVERDSGNPGTVIHEGVHKYSEGSFLNTLGFNANEGTTEFFARIICADLGVERGNYETQYKLIETLAGHVGKDTLAKAYFDGDIEALKKAFMAYRKSKKFVIARWFTSESTYENDWTKFVAHFDNGEYDKARKYIE